MRASLPITSSRHGTARNALLGSSNIIRTRTKRIYQMSASSAQGTLAIQTQGAAYRVHGHSLQSGQGYYISHDETTIRLPFTRKAPSGVHEHSTRHATRHFPEAQCAFKILMIHEIVQFALRIAFRCVLHRCRNLDIRC